MTRKLRTGIPAAMGLLIIILDTRTALAGAADGLQLCIRTVIPSLFPFFVLSALLTSALIGERLRILRPLGRLCGVSQGAESLLLVGMLGGYPAGAQGIAQAYSSGALSKTSAERMLPFCNLAGPAFLFGIVASKFDSPGTIWLLWGVHLLSAILVGALLPRPDAEQSVIKATEPYTLPEAVQRSLKVMATVCGWIILFRILIAFLDRWVLWLFPDYVQVAISGILELSCGCCDLGSVSNEGLRFIIAAGILSFGGVCVTMQTASVAKGLRMRIYILGKILQVLISILLAALLQMNAFPIPTILWIIFPSGIALIAKILHKKQKRYSFSRLIGV